jgi:hemerythrin
MAIATNKFTFLAWSDEYSLGIHAIDSDHKTLFDIVNTLHEGLARGVTNSNELGIAITGLARYVDEHFEREEKFMDDYCYPEAEAHKAEHRNFMRLVYAARKVHTATPQKLDPHKLLDFLRDWLTGHVLGSDKKIAPYLKGEIITDNLIKKRTHETNTASSRQVEPKQDLKTVMLEVPSRHEDVLRRVALMLRRGGVNAAALLDIADPVSHMSLGEAKDLIRDLLR